VSDGQARVSPSDAVRAAILAALDADPKTREPLNALVAWTEMGRALQGTLDRKGGDAGLLRRVIARWCAQGAEGRTADLGRWAYRLEPGRRLTTVELAAAIRRVQEACDAILADLARATGDDGGRAVFLALAKGWFPAGLDVVARLGAARGASPAEVVAALGAWCERFLPSDGETGKDLGVRVGRAP
jgi:hypothetical protein